MKTDKIYKAFVTDENGHRKFLEFEDISKKNALTNIRGNGYTVSDHYCKEKEVFDWVLHESERYGDPEDHYAIWRFTKIPKDDEEYKEMMDRYKKAYMNKLINQYVYRERKKWDRKHSY